VPKKPRKSDPSARILTIQLPAVLHRRFLKEVKAYDGNGDGHKEKFLFSLMKKYLAISKKNHV